MWRGLQDLRLASLPVIGLAAIGLYWGSIAAWLPAIKARAGVGDAQFGSLMVLSAIGGMAAMWLAPRLLESFGPRVYGWAAGAIVLTALPPALADSPFALGAALLGVGLSMSALDILANIRLSQLEEIHDRPLMNLAHGIFSLSLAASAAVMGLARGAGLSHLVATLGLMAVLALLAVRISRETAGWTVPALVADEAGSRIASWGVVLPAAAILFLSFMAENGTESWGAIHIERSLDAGAGLGAAGPAMFALSMGLARLGGQFAVQRMGEVRLLALCIATAFGGAVLLALAPSLTLAVLGAAALGLGVAVVVPTANSLLGQAVSAAERPSAIARAWMVGFTGFFIGPPVLGMVAEGANLRAAFLLIAGMVLAMAPALATLARQRQRRLATR